MAALSIVSREFSHGYYFLLKFVSSVKEPYQILQVYVDKKYLFPALFIVYPSKFDGLVHNFQ